jgi:hypothetical protein
MLLEKQDEGLYQQITRQTLLEEEKFGVGAPILI